MGGWEDINEVYKNVGRLSSVLSYICMEPKVKNDVKKIIWG
jgi:hypothetical protein